MPKKITGCMLERKARKITVDSYGLHLYLTCHNITDHFDYSPKLEKLLGTPCLCSYWMDSDNRLVVRLTDPINGIKHSHRANQLAYVANAFLGDYSDVNAFVHDYPSLWKSLKGDMDMTVDHLNNDVRNNRKYNLSLIPRTFNSRKDICMNAFSPPYQIYRTVDNLEKYRIMLAVPDVWGGEERYLFYMCDSIELLLNWLDTVLGRSTFTKRLTITHHKENGDCEAIPTPKSLITKKNAARNFIVDSVYAEWLRSLDEDFFMSWERPQQMNIRQLLNTVCRTTGFSETVDGIPVYMKFTPIGQKNIK